METETIDKLFLELAQVTRARTPAEIFLVMKMRDVRCALRELGDRITSGADKVELKIAVEAINGLIGDPWQSGYARNGSRAK